MSPARCWYQESTGPTAIPAQQRNPISAPMPANMMGSPPFLFASRVLADLGMDPRHDVEWVTMPADAMSKALDQGRVDAVASAEPIGTMLRAKNQVLPVCDQASDAPHQHGRLPRARSSHHEHRPMHMLDRLELFSRGNELSCSVNRHRRRLFELRTKSEDKVLSVKVSATASIGNWEFAGSN